jgi:hypothetical protein
LFYRYYKKLRSDDLFDFAFKKDAVMITAAERALTTLMNSPLEFGAMCTEARNEVWRFTRPWTRMLADHIHAIITKPGATSKADVSDALDLVVLLSNKFEFANYHKRHLAKRILNPLIGFEDLCSELEDIVIRRLCTVCDRMLLAKCERLLEDHYSSRRFSRELFEEFETCRPTLAPVAHFDIRYLSKYVWQNCGVW